jgi:Zn-dependent alcohol dehydrogenase
VDVVDVKPLITEILPLEQIQEACDKMWSGDNIVSMMTP